MTLRNNLCVLNWYTDIKEQDRNKYYSFGDVYPLYAHKKAFLNFFVEFPSTYGTLNHIHLLNPNGTVAASNINSRGGANIHQDTVTWQTTNDTSVVTCMNTNFTSALPIGQYYMELETNGGLTLYSDMITIVDDVTPYLVLEWWDDDNFICDNGIIPYSTRGFRNKVYLATELGRPEYNFDEEAEKRDGYTFPTKQVSYKTYKFVCMGNEPFLNALRLARLSDRVRITDKYMNALYADTFLITPEWNTQANIATVNAEFTSDTVAKKIGRVVTLGSTYGDFNDDFNDDFDN